MDFVGDIKLEKGAIKFDAVFPEASGLVIHNDSNIQRKKSGS